jgi:hypothetical protein
MIIQKGIYTDIPMFISRNPFTGDLSLKKDQNAIQESVRNIILTTIGERPFDNEFGTNINSILFEHPVMLQFYADGILKLALSSKEPRIRVDNITYDVSYTSVDIVIEYFIISLNVRDRFTITLKRTR